MPEELDGADGIETLAEGALKEELLKDELAT